MAKVIAGEPRGYGPSWVAASSRPGLVGADGHGIAPSPRSPVVALANVTDGQGPSVRPANDSDAEAVLELAAIMAVSFTVEREPFLRSFAAILDAPDAHLLVVESGSTVGGYLLGFEHPAFFANGPVGWVEEVAVRENLRRQHLGSRLMATFEDQVRERGGRIVALATTRASKFYEAIGYDHRAAYYRKDL